MSLLAVSALPGAAHGGEGFLSNLPFGGRKDPTAASNSGQARQEATDAIPLEKLSPDDRLRVLHVASSKSLFRRMPTETIRCDEDYFRFLVQHPDIVVQIWEAMEISQLKLRQTGPGRFQLHDVNGTTGTAEILYQDETQTVVLAEGMYSSPLWTHPIRGSSLLLLTMASSKNEAGQTLLTCRMEAFVSVENVGLEVVAKLFQPLFGKIADANFNQTMTFVESMVYTTEKNAPAMHDLALRLGGLSPRVRHEFAVMTIRIAQRARLADSGPFPWNEASDEAVAHEYPSGSSGPAPDRSVSSGISPIHEANRNPLRR